MPELLSPAEVSALLLSIKIAITAAVAELPLAVFLAFILARVRFFGNSFINILIHLPLILPPVVTGYFLLILFGNNGPIGLILAQYFGIILAFRWTGAALASAVMALPLMVRAIRLSIEAVDPTIENAARTLGANRINVFFSITLPLSYPGIIAGFILGFAKALGEFGATITFVSNIPGETQTLSAAIYTYTQSPGGDVPALRLAALSVIVSIAALGFTELLARHTRKA
ncbi:MAG: molybdate ABC transporter permease subunit [Alphaproteobacteria bacterium]|nr:molybdate ABC transporter permease subunit [Beijerinckiaceae bacterium]NBQ38777.1 molybdate ABC transporter permease subunit [Alphaproteobacteria bacterium]